MTLSKLDIREGPAFKALPNDRWRAFALIYCGNGHKNATQAYLNAWGLDRNDRADYRNAMRAGYGVLHDHRMQAAILEIAKSQLSSLAPVVQAGLAAIATNPQHTDHTKVLLAVADRIGMHAVNESIHRHENVTSADQVTNITRLAAILGIDAAKLLGNRIEAPVIDLTPEPVAEMSQSDDDEEW